ncbi:MAG: MFS transporter [Pseudomonadota bacterium]
MSDTETGAETDKPNCPERDRKFVLAASVLGSSMAFIDGTAVTLALQPIQEGLGAGLSDILWISNAYTLVLAAFILVGGSLGDLYGRRMIFLLGVALFAVASIFCGVAPTPETLIAGRAAQGLGAALLTPLSLALIAAAYPKAERGAAIGTWAAASAIMTAVGPPLGGFLAEAVSWRWIFFINAPIGLGAIVLTLWKTPRGQRSETPPAIDWAGACLAVFALGAVAWGLIELSAASGEGGEVREAHGASAIAWAAIGLGLAAGAAFVLQELRAKAPMAPPALFSSRCFNVVNLLTFFLYGAFGGLFLFYPLVLKEAYGHGVDMTGRAFLGFAVTMGVLSRLSGRFIDRFGTRAMLTAGSLVATLGMWWMALSPVSSEIFAGAFIGMLIFGAGMSIVVPALSTAIFNATEEKNHGAASGVNNAVARAAALFAVAGFGVVAATGFEAAAGDAARAAGFGQGSALAGPALADYRSAMASAFAAVGWGAVVLGALSALAAALFLTESAEGGGLRRDLAHIRMVLLRPLGFAAAARRKHLEK